MKPTRLFLLALLWLVPPGAACAQERFQDRLPENTLLYFASSGRQGIESVRATNPLLRLLASPEMKANWEAVRTAQPTRGDAEAEPTIPQQDEEFPEFLELLKAPGLLAVLPPALDAAPHPAGAPQPRVLFLLHASGQESRIERLKSRAVANGTTYASNEFQGVVVEESRGKNGEVTGYLAHVDHWLVGGNDKAATEAWIGSVRHAPERSLKDAEVFRNARAMLTQSGQWEAYVNLPALVDFFGALPGVNPSAPPPEQIVAALGLRAFGPLLGTAEFLPTTTRYQLALGRRQAAASPLDALAPDAAQFASLSLGGADAVGYSATRINLQAGWDYLQGAAARLFPPATAFVQLADSFLEQNTSFTLAQLMSVWGDELAHFEYTGEGGKSLETVWALRHRDATRVQALVEGTVPILGQRLGMRELARVEAKEGMPAYYKLKPGATPGLDNQPVPPSYFLAVTDQWLVFTLSEAALKHTLARAADAPSLADSEMYRRARGRFPAKLSSFGFVDVDAWLASGVVESLIEQAAAAQQSKATGGNDADDAAAAPPPAMPKLTIPRGYLKWIVTATTQDARGIYHTGYIE